MFTKTVSEYTDANRKSLSKKYNDFESFDRDFVTDSKIIDRLVENARKEGIEFDETDVEKSTAILKTQIKAVVAQGLFGTEAYFWVVRANNDALQKAIDLIEK